MQLHHLLPNKGKYLNTGSRTLLKYRTAVYEGDSRRYILTASACVPNMTFHTHGPVSFLNQMSPSLLVGPTLINHYYPCNFTLFQGFGRRPQIVTDRHMPLPQFKTAIASSQVHVMSELRKLKTQVQPSTNATLFEDALEKE